jgi:tetratricopeptide (TPR) repeat protein
MRPRFLLFAIIAALILFCGTASPQLSKPSTEQVVVPPPPPGASALELEETADMLRARKDYSQALAYLRAAIRDDPKNAILFNKCGIVEIQLNDTSAARKDIKKALKLNPDYAEARNNLGVTYYMDRNYKKAIGEYEKAIKLRGNMASFYANLGAAWFARKKVDLAMEQYTRALQLDPGILLRTAQGGVAARIASPEDRAYYNYVLAKLFAKHGDVEQSIEFLRRAREQGYAHLQDVYKDPEFAFVRLDPRFTDMMADQVGK